MKFELPTWEQLPNVDLYMDQVLTYLNDELGQLYFHNEKFVTSSMINNYVKIGIVKRPEKKHYTKVSNVRLFKDSLVKIIGDIFDSYDSLINLFGGQCQII